MSITNGNAFELMHEAITGINITLIERLHTILAVQSSGKEIDPNKFKKYSIETAEQYIEHYSWYHMPQSLHKILIRGADVIQQINIAIGSISEEAQESRNKEFRRHREGFSRKSSRTETNTDIVIRLLCSSDPYISSLRNRTERKIRTLPDDASLPLKLDDDIDSDSGNDDYDHS